MEDLKFDAELEGFFSGTGGGTVNLSASPTLFGSSLEDGPKGRMSSASEGSSAAGASGAAAVMSGLMGGRMGFASTLFSGVMGGAVEKMTAASVPTSFQPVKESAGNFLSRAQPWRQFVLPLSVPPASEGCSRITANLYNFQTNYAILFVVNLILSIVLNPSALICICLTVASWILFLKKNDDPDWQPKIGGVVFSPMQRMLLLAFATAIVLLFWVGGAIFNSALMYMFFAIAHGVVHDPASKPIPGNDPIPI